MIKKFLFAVFLASGILSAGVGQVFAQRVDVFDDVCKKASSSSVCKDVSKDDENPLYGPDGIITIVVNLFSVVVGIAAVIALIAAGIKYAASGENAKEAGQAREIIIYALIGLVLVALAQAIVGFTIDQVK